VNMPRLLDVCGVADLPDEGSAVVTDPVAGRIVIFRVAEEYFGLQDRCSHQEARLSDGFLDGCAVECPLHASLFDLRTGLPEMLPATEPVRTYPVHVAGDRIVVDAGAPSPDTAHVGAAQNGAGPRAFSPT